MYYGSGVGVGSGDELLLLSVLLIKFTGTVAESISRSIVTVPKINLPISLMKKRKGILKLSNAR